jgi:multicomponent K+:H+ antiporter subunit D
MLGIGFSACGMLLAGLPPLSGFVAKFALLSAMLAPQGEAGVVPVLSWWVVTLIILSGVAALIAMSRAGIRTFWAPVEAIAPRVQVLELAAVAALLALTVVLTLAAGPAMRFMEATAASLSEPAYVDGVMGAPRVPRTIRP